jgi:hypothetical protein
VAGELLKVNVAAQDAGNNSDPAYAGTVVLASSDRRASFPASLKFPTKHQATGYLDVTFRTAGAQTLTVVNASNPLHHGRVTVLVTPGPAGHFRVSASAAVAAGKPCEITVAALDKFDNTDSEFTGTVHLTSDAPGAMMPADFTFAAGDEGTHVFRVSFPKEGEWSVTVADTGRRALVGSGKVRVRPDKREGASGGKE